MGMKPRSKGRPKSKRVTLKDKYKVLKKVKEHNRKKRKQERLNGKSKLKKDPGVPSMHPFRKEIVQEIQEAKERNEQERQEQKQRQKDMKQKKLMDLESLQRDAEARGRRYDTARDFEKKESKKELKDQSRRAFFDEFAKVIEKADVILQILDARDPIASRSELVENAVLQCSRSERPKKLILVLNKIDLVPRSVTAEWLKYFRHEYPTIAFKASTQSQRKNLSQGPSLAASQGVAPLMTLLKKFKGPKGSITVGVVGYPNVGKSSIINSLMRRKSLHVGQRPGITRHSQIVELEDNISLFDSPGIVFSSKSDLSSLVLRNCISMESLQDPARVIERLLRRCDVSQIMEFYGLPSFDSTVEFLQLLAKRMGKLKKGGIPNIDASANQVLRDFHTGKISYYTRPPQDYVPDSQIGAQFVSELGEDFLSKLYNDSDDSLRKLPDKKDMKKSARFEFFPSEKLSDDVGSFQVRGAEEDADQEDEEMAEE
eukprot:m.40923 g.40923  ORF g.40923 m.40923 type:complete len:486 (+) comp10389_c1_seq1:150-1607(+)